MAWVQGASYGTICPSFSLRTLGTFDLLTLKLPFLPLMQSWMSEKGPPQEVLNVEVGSRTSQNYENNLSTRLLRLVLQCTLKGKFLTKFYEHSYQII